VRSEVKYLGTEDQLEIARLLSAYGYALDSRSFDALRMIFADDAEIDYYHGTDIRHGIEAIVDFFSKTATSVAMTRHIWVLISIDEKSIDATRVWCNVTAHRAKHSWRGLAGRHLHAFRTIHGPVRART
jgi:hypothetical protein